MDCFKGKITGKPHIEWENLWFPVDFPLNQSIQQNITVNLERNPSLGMLGRAIVERKAAK